MRRSWGWAALGLAVVAGVGGGAGGFAAGRLAAQAERRWPAYDGREWAQLAPREKHALVTGFLIGGALADAERAGVTDSAGLHRSVDSLFSGGNLRFPFGHVVYATQLDEFYWWDNHIPVPLYLALRDVNVRLKRQKP